MNLLPAYIEDEDEIEELEEEIKPPREYGIDFKTGQLTGEIVEGKEAIRFGYGLFCKRRVTGTIFTHGITETNLRIS